MTPAAEVEPSPEPHGVRETGVRETGVRETGVRGTALLGNVVHFARVLRAAGLPISTGQTVRLARALTRIDLARREQVFYTAQALLVTRPEHLHLFAVLFARHFDQAGTPPTHPRSRRVQSRPHVPFLVASYLAAKAGEGAEERDVVDRAGTASARERLRRKRFATMNDEELRAVRRMIEQLPWQPSPRASRRRTPDRRGRHTDLRRALRTTAQLGSVPHRLPRRRRKEKPRPLVLIADVSGSMERHARLLLQWLYGVRRSNDAVECFVFGTRLTRLTPQLTLRNVDRALDEAARQVLDWGGGTRIGESLAAFGRHWSRRVLGRGAMVVVVSDGCERGDPRTLAHAVQALQRRCHRLIWLHPHLGHDDFAPRTAGLAAALPFVDDFLPIQDLASLEQLANHLHSVSGRRRDSRDGRRVAVATSRTQHTERRNAT